MSEKTFSFYTCPLCEHLVIARQTEPDFGRGVSAAFFAHMVFSHNIKATPDKDYYLGEDFIYLSEEVIDSFDPGDGYKCPNCGEHSSENALCYGPSHPLEN